MKHRHAHAHTHPHTRAHTYTTCERRYVTGNLVFFASDEPLSFREPEDSDYHSSEAAPLRPSFSLRVTSCDKNNKPLITLHIIGVMRETFFTSFLKWYRPQRALTHNTRKPHTHGHYREVRWSELDSDDRDDLPSQVDSIARKHWHSMREIFPSYVWQFF
jgi:hypothetical protein